MSWDASILFETCYVCGRGAESKDVRNVTYNNSRIFTELGVHPDTLNGKCAMEVTERLGVAIAKSYEIEKNLKSFEPQNGWGGIADARDFLVKLHRVCLEYPKGTVVFR